MPGLFAEQLGYKIELTPGEVAGFAFTALWNAEPIEIAPKDLGLLEQPTAVRVLDIVDPHAED